MKTGTVQQIEAMDEFRLLRFFNYFSNILFNKVNADLEQIIDLMPGEIKNLPEMKVVVNQEAKYSKPLEQKEAVDFARTSLRQMAQDDSMEPALAEAIKNYRDDEQPAGVILALGGAVSFIYLLATSKIIYKNKKWEINLGGNRDPKEIEGVTNLVKELFNVIPNSILSLVKKN
ncbi:MAG: hypothetical protein ABI729_07005 [Chitinophagales bacterium]